MRCALHRSDVQVTLWMSLRERVCVCVCMSLSLSSELSVWEATRCSLCFVWPVDQCNQSSACHSLPLLVFVSITIGCLQPALSSSLFSLLFSFSFSLLVSSFSLLAPASLSLYRPEWALSSVTWFIQLFFSLSLFLLLAFSLFHQIVSPFLRLLLLTWVTLAAAAVAATAAAAVAPPSQQLLHLAWSVAIFR